MKNIEEELVKELRSGGCVPAITKLARKLSHPGSTIHFNIRKMEKEGKILAYKAVLNNSKVDAGFTGFALVKLSAEAYERPGLTSEIAKRIARHPQVESVDALTGDWELIVKIRARDQKEYFTLVQRCIGGRGVVKVNSMISLEQFKSEYVEC
ncbi:MAG: Lrp/AsnC family transcriptional regulator [Candidatus Micrarchaeota archaeon]|nr:Lrp/AsnC family transcriptional regulator [Candidatus Micrarchaeota archaeon]